MAASVPKNLMFQWNEKIKVNCSYGMIRGTACAIGTVAYFNAGGTSSVYCYDYVTKQWTSFSEHVLVSDFTFVAISDLLTAVGGYKSNKLLTFNKGKWVEMYPPMSTKRGFLAAVCTGHSLVVAGGRGEHGQGLMTVEVMDTNTLQWFTVASLPRGIYWASMTTCGDDLYLFGDDSTRVYSCSLQALLQSCQVPENSTSASQQTSIWNRIIEKISTSQQTNVWNRITDLPVLNSTAITLCGQLVSVGGSDGKGRTVDTVYCYDPATSAWKTIGQIPSRRSCPLVTTLPGDKLIIVHGAIDNTTIDVASAIVS